MLFFSEKGRIGQVSSGTSTPLKINQVQFIELLDKWVQAKKMASCIKWDEA